MKTRRPLAGIGPIALLVMTALCPSAAAFTLSNFDNPQCVRVDPEDNVYYVSNLNGPRDEKTPAGGYISKISPNGNLVFQKWIGGKGPDSAAVLRAPKGLAIYRGQLYVADSQEIKIFSKKTMRAVHSVDLAGLGARELCGLAVDPEAGMLYASDGPGNQIFRIELERGNRAALYKRSSELGNPKAVMINPRNRNVMVAASQSGQILEIDRQLKIHVLRRGLNALEGMDYDNLGNLYVSSVAKGEIYKIGFYGRGMLSVYLSGLTTPGDICYDRKKDQLVIPSLKRNTVITVFRDRLPT